MKNKLLGILFLLCFHGQAQNLLTNGDFEEGLTNWNLAQNEDGAEVQYSEGSEVFEGTKALNVEVQAKGKNTWNIRAQQPFASVQDQAYRIRLRAKSTKPNSTLLIQLQNTTYTQKRVQLNSDWQEIVWDVIAKEDDLTFALHFFDVATYAIDNITLEEYEAPILTNGNFEEGNEGWYEGMSNGANAVFTMDTDAPKEGKNTMRVLMLKNGTNPWDVVLTKKMNTKKNNKYLLTFQAKAKDDDTPVRIQLQNKTYTQKNITLSSGWREYEWLFSAKEDALTLAFQFIKPGLFYLDDIKVKALGGKKKKKKKKKKE